MIFKKAHDYIVKIVTHVKPLQMNLQEFLQIGSHPTFGTFGK